MFSFLRRLFRAPPAPADDDVVEESFESDFSRPKRARFREEEEERYRSLFVPGGLRLELKQPRLFAWTENPIHRYSDFLIEGDIAFEPGAEAEPGAPRGAEAGAAAGFLFRYADESNFYSAMVSDSGHLRLDAVFNGSPRPLVAWTETSAGTAERFVLTVIARGSRICIMVNGLWAAEVEDDSFGSGYVAFGAENFGVYGSLAARLEGFLVDSRPVEVETAYERAQSPVFQKPAARLALAETFLAMGLPRQAASHMRLLAASKPLDARERFVLAEARVRSGLLEEAAEDLDKTLGIDPAHPGARAEKANVIYLQGKYRELLAYLETLMPDLDGNANLWNLLGHARYDQGAYREAAEAYRKAADLDPAQSIYALNAARSLDTGGEKDAAAESYLAAAKVLLNEDGIDDLALVVSRLEALAPGRPGLAALKGKLLYREGRKAEAASVLEGLIASGQADSSVYYLEGLLLRDGGKAEESIDALRRACELEPDFPLYRFRLAESLFLDGREAAQEIERALALAPDDGWILNLAGQQRMERGEREEARDLLSRAVRALPGEIDPRINLSALLCKEGRTAEALECVRALADESDAAALAKAHNQAGNVLGEAKDLEGALAEYDAALRLAPENAEIRLNRAACLIELDRFSDAEADLRFVLETAPDGRAYVLMGRLAEIYGDYPRAEVAFRAALENSPRDFRVMEALAEVYLSSRRFPKAEEAIVSMEDSNHPRAEEYRRKLHDMLYDSVVCAACGREWSTPKDLGPQGAVRVSGGLPDHAPAGSCPSCGKVYCIGCRKDDLEEDRLVCPDCRAPLKLSDDKLKYLALKSSGAMRPGT